MDYRRLRRRRFEAPFTLQALRAFAFVLPFAIFRRTQRPFAPRFAMVNLLVCAAEEAREYGRPSEIVNHASCLAFTACKVCA